MADSLAVSVYAYAVMSNHMHVVVHLNPGVAWVWSPQKVAARRSRLFPVCEGDEIDEQATRLRAWELCGNLERVAVCRPRLASLS